MSKQTLFISIFVILLVIVGGYFMYVTYVEAPIVTQTLATDPKDATYQIAGQKVTLSHGESSVPAAPGSASMITTRYFGNEAVYDFNGDGRDDVAFLLTQDTGGSGLFYYLVVALNTADGYVGSEAMFIGDRIAPQTTEVRKDGVIIVNYADRNPGESFAVKPSVGKSLYAHFDPATMQIGEVVQNFEGEANPAQMTLGMKKWEWVNTLYNDGKTVVPKKSGIFSLTFRDAKNFSATTDCNGVGGDFTVQGNTITLDHMISTLMYCDGSQEQDFTKMLGQIQSYHFTSKGELIFDLKMDSGVMVFK